MYFGDLDARCDRGHHHPDRSHSDCPLRPFDADEVEKMEYKTHWIIRNKNYGFVENSNMLRRIS